MSPGKTTRSVLAFLCLPFVLYSKEEEKSTFKLSRRVLFQKKSQDGPEPKK